MTAEPIADTPATLPDPPAPPSSTADREITLEEWIAAGQACCGVGTDE